MKHYEANIFNIRAISNFRKNYVVFGVNRLFILYYPDKILILLCCGVPRNVLDMEL